MSDFDELFERVRAERRETEALAAGRGPKPAPVVPLTGYELMRALGAWALEKYLVAGIAPTYPSNAAGPWHPRRVVARPAPEPGRWWRRRTSAGPLEYEPVPDLWEIFSYEISYDVQGKYVPVEPGMYDSGGGGYYEKEQINARAVVCTDREGNLVDFRQGCCLAIDNKDRPLFGVVISDEDIKHLVMNTVDRAIRREKEAG
ncbi:hypothetical protein ACIA8O_37185 [Kitasatospora sp. NPDC051853]|uniref:hypothetical protein n=1 Tax=Kitasatospora sp. NPDC051853 TaxID=3364058 RepID=UPI0037B75D3A